VCAAAFAGSSAHAKDKEPSQETRAANADADVDDKQEINLSVGDD